MKIRIEVIKRLKKVKGEYIRYQIFGENFVLWIGIIGAGLSVFVWIFIPILMKFHFLEKVCVFIYERLYERGFIPHLTMVIYTLGVMNLIFRLSKINVEKQGLNQLDNLLKSRMKGKQISLDTVLSYLEEIEVNLDRYKDCMIIQLIKTGLERLLNTGSLSDMERLIKEMLKTQRDKIEGKYSLVRLVAGVIPILGFLGTVYGISMAIAKMGIKSSSIEELMHRIPHVTHELGIAFDTTLIALACSAILLFLIYVIHIRDENLVYDIDDYLLRKFLPKIRLLGTEAALISMRDRVVQAIEDEITLIELLKKDIENHITTVSKATEKVERKINQIVQKIDNIDIKIKQMHEDVKKVYQIQKQPQGEMIQFVNQLKELNGKLSILREIVNALHKLVLLGENVDKNLAKLEPAIERMSSKIIRDMNYTLRKLLKAITVAYKLDRLNIQEIEYYKEDLEIFHDDQK